MIKFQSLVIMSSACWTHGNLSSLTSQTANGPTKDSLPYADIIPDEKTSHIIKMRKWIIDHQVLVVIDLAKEAGVGP